MTIPSAAIGVEPEFLNLRECSNAKACSETAVDAEKQVCGWRIFDEVVIVVDVSLKAPKNAGDALTIKGLACRSCGALQPAGIPPEILQKMDSVEKC